MRKKLLKNTFEISNVLKLLSNKDRLAILGYIDKDKKDVSSIIKYIDAPQSTVSNHLSTLKKHNVLESKRKGRKVYYKIKDENILELMKYLKKVFL